MSGYLGARQSRPRDASAMNDGPNAMLVPPGNPFSTRHISPRVVRYLFPDAMDGGRLAERLCQAGWWGQIVGPHGSGKTALLHTLRPCIEKTGRSVDYFEIHANQSHLDGLRRRARRWDAQTQVIVDGYEQLGRLGRWRLKRHCRAAEAGLLVTTHDDAGLPDLWRTRTTLDLLQTLVRQLLPDDDRPVVTEWDVARAFADHQGNVREALLTLYDVVEQRAGAGPHRSPGLLAPEDS